MNGPSDDPSIDHEPHLRQRGFTADPGEAAAERLVDAAAGRETDDQRVEHTVWDEPALTRELSGPVPDGALVYDRWLDRRIAGTSAALTWVVTLAVAAASGPWAILGALLFSGQTTLGIVMITVFAPVAEEMMKVAAALWVVEKRPFLFRSSGQIAICALAGGFVFAAVENVLYLTVYVDEPTPWLVVWRWTVCVALHMGCSFVAGLGLMKIWRLTIQHRTRPRLAVGAPYMVAAMVIHGLYNGSAVLLELFDFQF